jgi:two-component system, LytTR family, response regulator
MLKAVLVDDDSRDMELMEMLLQKYCAADILVAGRAQNVQTAASLILELKPDVVFLDIELGGESGFDLLAKFTHFPFRVIFVTAYNQYAIKAIRFNALDYILKPVEITELVNAVAKMKQAERLPVDAELKNLLHTLAHPSQKTNRVAIPTLTGYQMVSINDIQYCEAKKEYTYIYCVNQPPVCSSINLGEYEELLREYAFCRVHHSYLVNKDHVRQYVRGEGGELLIDKDIAIPVSRRKKQEVVDWLTAK